MHIFRLFPLHRRRGQILLITLLVLTVATTIALSLIGRATIDLSMSNQLEESTRAFDAAEAGIEQALKTGLGTAQPTVLTPGVTYDVSVNTIGGIQTGIYQVAHTTLQNTTETLWLAEHDASGALIQSSLADRYTANTLELCWSKETAPNPAAALEVSVLYYESVTASYMVGRIALDPNALTRLDNFDDARITTTGCGLGYYGTTLDFWTDFGITVNADALLSLRVKPYYADTTIAINGTSLIPKQGNLIESVGKTGSGVSRKVVVYQQYKTPLSVFDSVIHSESFFGH